MATTSDASSTQNELWPVELRALFSVLTRPAPVSKDRRSRPRAEYRARAVLRMPRGHQPAEVEIYLRDYDDRAVSFIAPKALPTNQKLELELTGGDGGQRRVPCRVGRCRQFCEGWFEGVLHTAR